MIGRISRYEIGVTYRDHRGVRPIDCSVTVVGANWTLELEHISVHDVPEPGEEVQVTWTDLRGRVEIERVPLQGIGPPDSPPEDMKL